MAARVTIHDVARCSGVSVATVSKVLNGRDGVSAATAKRVKGVIEELGYESSIVARSLRSRRTSVIGVLLPGFEPFSSEVVKGISEELTRSEYDLLAYAGAGGSARAGWEHRSLTRLSGTLIDGALLVTPTVVEADSSIPVVAIDPHVGPTRVPFVDSDNEGGARAAIAHLVELGHARVAFVSGRDDLESSRARERGYRGAMHEAGLDVPESYVITGEFLHDSARGAAASLLAQEHPPTAVFAANDVSAIAVIDEARERGLEVPRDLSVVGFDDVPEATRAKPPLTTVRQSMHEMGGKAARMMLDLLAGRPLEASHIQLPASLVIRGTTAPPRPTV